MADVLISNSVSSIGTGAFDNTPWYANWQENLPDGIAYIGTVAYLYKGDPSYCTTITLKEGTTGIGPKLFDGFTYLLEANLPSSLITIGDYAFRKCKNLEEIVIPNSVTTIGIDAFDECGNLTSVTLGDSISTIGYGAFGSCPNLENVYGPDIATWCNINFGDAVANPIANGKNLYLDGKLVVDLVIPNTVTTINLFAFCQCETLKSVKIPNSVTRIRAYAFEECVQLSVVELPNSITSIDESLFDGCKSLTNIVLPSHITHIDERAFCGSGLTNLTIPASVETIDGYAFEDCEALTTINIPKSVKNIYRDVFRGCVNLRRIDSYVNPEEVYLGVEAFDGVPKDGTLHVLPQYLSAYQTADQWKDFFNIKADLELNDTPGDSNGDGIISGADVTALYSVLLDGVVPAGNADVNGDTVVSGADVTALYTILLEQ